MMQHKISVTFERGEFKNVSLRLHIHKCIRAALEMERVLAPCEINVLVTDNAGIRKINKMYRGIDKATDVLSFPMFTLDCNNLPTDWAQYKDPETGLVPLGDMAISLEQTKIQAEQFGHGVRRELGYLTVHSVLHLLGYDHVDEGEMKKQMRMHEEKIMTEILLPQ